MADKNGGPAFPGKGEATMPHTSGTYEIDEPGMSLHQYYAGQAIDAVMKNLNEVITGNDLETVAQTVASVSVLIADAMIAEYERRTKESDNAI